ncbi:MAG: hypothetical protein ABEL76_08315, partial [Bradymonadaceae bacterium]
ISSGETKVEKVLNAARDRLATLRSRTSCEICVKGKDGEPETLTETLRNKLADWIANRDVEVVACRAGRGAGGSDAQGGERAPGDGSNASASDGSSADVAATERNRSRDGSGRASESHSRRLRLNVELNMRCKRPKGAEKLHMCRAFAQFDLENLQQGTTVLSKSIGGEEIRETRRNLRHAQSLTLDNLVELARDFLTEVFGRPA